MQLSWIHFVPQLECQTMLPLTWLFIMIHVRMPLPTHSIFLSLFLLSHTSPFCFPATIRRHKENTSEGLETEGSPCPLHVSFFNAVGHNRASPLCQHLSSKLSMTGVMGKAAKSPTRLQRLQALSCFAYFYLLPPPAFFFFPFYCEKLGGKHSMQLCLS